MVDFRHLESLADFDACVALQRETWGASFSDVVPGSLLQVSQKVGGLLGGAFEDDALIGFVYSLLGAYEGSPMHWSHMLAVRPGARGKGLGRRLKLFQREELIKSGIETVFWTFDPMVAANAHLNLNRLGATILRYAPNMYGANTDSPLHVGGETDRLITRWDLTGQRTKWAIDEGQTKPPLRMPDDASVVDRTSGGNASDLPEGNEVLIEVPTDLMAPRVSEADLVAWRQTVRNAFMTYLRRGYAVQSFHRDADADRSYYLLRRA